MHHHHFILKKVPSSTFAEGKQKQWEKMKKQEFQLEALNPSNTYLLLRLQMEYTALYKM